MTWRGLGALMIVAILGSACSSNGTDVRRDVDTSGSAAAEFPYIPPSAAATDAIGGFPLDRSGRDCGSGVADTGYPTTTAPTRPTTCLRDADRDGEAAFTIITGRDGSGGALLTSYRTEGRGSLSVIDLYADPRGTLHVTRWTCAVPQTAGALSIAFGGIGHLVVTPLAACHRAGR